MAVAAVRLAEPTDAAEIARIQLTTWRSAYADLLPPDALDALRTDEIEGQWHDTLTTGPATVLVAVEGEWLVGFCAAGLAPAAEAAAADGTTPDDAASLALLSSLVVEPRWGRRGHGGRLLGTVAARLTTLGAQRCITWVPEADVAATTFFGSIGWEPDGTVRTLDAAGRPLRELRFSGSLDLRLSPGTTPNPKPEM